MVVDSELGINVTSLLLLFSLLWKVDEKERSDYEYITLRQTQ
ncbi:hypothetical protein AAZV13_08G067600 [Glycine max]